MKKIVLFAAVICGLCGCVKSETVIDESEQHREIAFKPFNTKDAMRAPIDGTKLPDDARLGVFAFYHGAKAQKYFENVIFRKKTGTDNTWAGVDATGASRPYYWPTAGTLDFFAYYPMFDNAGQVAMYYYNNEVSSFAGHAIDITDSQYDLMFSDLLLGKTSADAGTLGIPITMHHALAQVVVNIKKTAETPKLIVTKVTLNKVFMKAEAFTCEFRAIEGDNTKKQPVGSWVWYTPATSRSDFDIKNANTSTTESGKTGMEITTNLKQYGDGALIIPFPYVQDTTPNEYAWQTSITIEYTFDNGGVESEVTHTIDLNAGITEAKDKAIWEMGKKYTYNITIGLNQILFEPTVDDWDEVAGKDIPIE